MERAKAAQRGFAFIVTATSFGTLIEWYDFLVYGSLAPIIGSIFFPPGAPPGRFVIRILSICGRLSYEACRCFSFWSHW